MARTKLDPDVARDLAKYGDVLPPNHQLDHVNRRGYRFCFGDFLITSCRRNLEWMGLSIQEVEKIDSVQSIYKLYCGEKLVAVIYDTQNPCAEVLTDYQKTLQTLLRLFVPHSYAGYLRIVNSFDR